MYGQYGGQPSALLDQSQWARMPPSQPGPPPTSPGYALFGNGTMPQRHAVLPMQMHQHQHHTSLSHFAPPTNGHSHQPHPVPTGSPASVPSQIMTPHWQQQLLKCEMSRQARSPHHRARASAMASRSVAKSAVTITNPSLVRPVPITAPVNGSVDPDGVSLRSSTPLEASPGTGTNHPSSTVAPIAEAPRPTSERPPENTWNSLDMGGVQIKVLPPTSGLWGFAFLINLYLNHNALTVLPPQIARLRHLQLLDVSGNALQSLPSEIGMIVSLKELYVFDNHLTTLPPEIGTLHQLQTLGVEGNPLEPNLKQMVQKEGTHALISYLRDSCPVPAAPQDREWLSVISDHERESLAADPHAEVFRVLSYNILNAKYATERLYGYTPAWALAWDYRKELILHEIRDHDADFICLQEVDGGQYEEFFLEQLREQGYEGVHWAKTRHRNLSEADRRAVDGCAILYKAAKYQLIENHIIEFASIAMQRQDFKKTDDMFNRVLGKDHIAGICLMEDKHSGTRFVIANAHICWEPNYRDVKLVQVALLIDEVEQIADSFAKLPPRPPPTPSSTDGEDALPQRTPPVYSDGTKIPTIVCGDYNSVPDSGVYEFLSSGSLPANHPDFMNHTYGRYTSDGLRHRLNLKNAYAGIDLPMTNFTPSYQGVLDYVWYSASTVGVNAVLGKVDEEYLEKVVGFPNPHFPSDHLMISGEFRIKAPRPQTTTTTSSSTVS